MSKVPTGKLVNGVEYRLPLGSRFKETQVWKQAHYVQYVEFVETDPDTGIKIWTYERLEAKDNE